MKFAIRTCRSVQEFEACVSLQREIWGYSDTEAYPSRVFVNLGRAGGHVLAAFTPEDELAGFVASMPAWRKRQLYFHSLSLGVKPRFENQGLGRALKLAQRRRALKEGIGLIKWTFDPLRAKNAFFNLMRLGAMAREYIADYYGPVASRLQLGLPSDRLIAEWQLRSPRVKRALSGQPPRGPRKPPAAMVEIPSDLERLAANDLEQARVWQSSVRKELRKLLRRGLIITGFERGETTSRYLLEKL